MVVSLDRTVCDRLIDSYALSRSRGSDLIAAEIMEVTADKISIHIFWDIESINLSAILNRIGHIIQNLFAETVDLLDTCTDTQDIVERGSEVQRQVLLAKRAISYALRHSFAAQKFNMTSIDLYYTSYVIYFFGKIAEYIVQISRIICDAHEEKLLGAKSKTQLKALLQRTSVYFAKVLENYHKKGDQSRFVISEYQSFEAAIGVFRVSEKHTPKQVWIPIVAEYLKMIINKVKETEFVMINIENSPK